VLLAAVLGKDGKDAGELAQALERLLETRTRCQTLHQIEHITLGGGIARIPPAMAIMVDDEDPAAVASIFECLSGALLSVEPPGRRQPLQHGATMDLGLEPRDGVVTMLHAGSPIHVQIQVVSIADASLTTMDSSNS